MNDLFVFNYKNLKITTEKKGSGWETNIFCDDRLCAEIKHKNYLLDLGHKKKIEQAIKNFIPEIEERTSILLDLSDSFSKSLKIPKKRAKSLQALNILNRDPMTFLLKEVEKVHPGDRFGITLYILSLMSMNPAVGYYVHIESVGKSGGGKSHGQKVCKRLLPPEMQHSIDSMSAKSLIYYAKDNSLKNKLVIIDDATEKDIEMLKHVGNNGLEPFTYSTVIDGNYVDIKADSSPLIWFSKVRPLDDEGGQISSRFLVYNIDESKEQRFKVLDSIQKDIKDSISPLCVEIINECITLNIKDINAGNFKIPNPETIGFRDANFFKALIKCCTLLNHRKREIISDVLYATEEDIKVVEELWAEISRYNKHKLSAKDVAVYDAIPSDLLGISTSEIRKMTGIPKTTLQRILDSMENKELIKRYTNGHQAYYYRN